MAAESFDEFVRARSPGLLPAAYLLTGDDQLAEDLVQTALVKTSMAWRRLERQQNADAYARRVLYNQQVTWWRRRRVQEVLGRSLPERPDRTSSTGSTFDSASGRRCASER